MKILVLAGDFWHPMELVKRGITKMGFDPDEYEFDFVEDAKDIVTKDLINEQDLIVFAKGNVLSSFNNDPMFKEGNGAPSIADYREFVENGGGLISVHAGNTGHMDRNPEWCEFVGNSFQGHPRRCDVEVYPVKEHFITEGVKPFTEMDEHYMLGDVPEDAEIIIESRSEAGGVQPAGFIRNIGKGKLFVLTPGHTMYVWGDKEFVKIFKNAVEFCARR